MAGEAAPKLISTKSSLLPFDDEGWRGENVASIATAFLRVQVGRGEGPGTGERKKEREREEKASSGVERKVDVRNGKQKEWLSKGGWRTAKETGGR